jgi:nucleotide-binding universal stress UspA family protein
VGTQGKVQKRMFKRILVPLDGTPTAAAAVTLALRLARMTTAELVLVRVVSAHGSESEAGQAYLDGVVGNLPADAPHVETLVRTGRQVRRSSKQFWISKPTWS